MQQRIISSEADVAEGSAWLAAHCPLMARLHAEIGEPPLRLKPTGFAGLMAIVAAQQLSAASAAAITRRLQMLMPVVEAGAFRAMADADLRTAGLSGRKIANLRALADAILDGRIDLGGLEHAHEDELRRAIIAQPGLGPWSADCYLLFCLGRADAFAPGDLALQIAIGELTARGKRLNANDAEKFAERWRPWRAVAARLLWAYYGLSIRRKPGETRLVAPIPVSATS